MTRKKNKFLTFCCSLIPGAAHMYMGFMKIGISLMSIFWATIFLGATFNMDVILLFLPIIWFYSFFDANNKNTIDDEEFYQLEDDYLFHIKQFEQLQTLWNRKGNTIIAVLLIFGGIYLLINPIMNWLYENSLLPYKQWDVIWDLYQSMPQIFLAFVIIILGIRLIRGKKQEYQDTERRDYDGRTY